jgi:hypothetical protein
MDSNNKKIVIISKESRFNKRFGFFYFFILVLLFPTTLILIFNLMIIPTILSVLLYVIIINLLFNIQGIEIDKEKNIFRNYKKFFFYKYGSWMDFNNFKILSITSDHLSLSKSFYSGGYETHFYYYVSFVNESSKLNIRIAEFDDYYKAYSFAKKTSVEFNLEIKDHIKGKTVTTK